VLGKITAVSNAAIVRNTSGDLMMRRIIKLQDHKYDFKLLSLFTFQLLVLFLTVTLILRLSNQYAGGPQLTYHYRDKGLSNSMQRLYLMLVRTIT